MKNGGNLLVTGSVGRDEHWHAVDRLMPLGISGHSEPLLAHNVDADSKDGGARMTFAQEKQKLVEFVKFEDGNLEKQISLGKGKIFWTAYPVELAEGSAPAAFSYSRVFQQLNIKPSFDAVTQNQNGVLIYPIELQNAVLYIFESERDTDAAIDLHDHITGAALKFSLPAQHAAMALIDKDTRKIVARYGF